MFLKHIPNLLSFSRIILSSYGVYAFFQQRYFLTIILFAISLITDYIDGPLARRWKATSLLGKYLDHIGDIFSVVALMVMIYYIHPGWILSYIPNGLNHVLKSVYRHKVNSNTVELTYLDEVCGCLNQWFFPSSLFSTLMFPSFGVLVKPMFALTVGLGLIAAYQSWKRIQELPHG